MHFEKLNETIEALTQGAVSGGTVKRMPEVVLKR